MRMLLLAVVTLAGCATMQQPMVWVRPAYNEADYRKDAAQCQYEGAAATASYSTGRTARGISAAFAQGFGEGMEIALRRNELFDLCMRARGYSQQLASGTFVIPASSTPAY